MLEIKKNQIKKVCSICNTKETILEKCDRCKKLVCMYHIMGDGTEKGGMYCDRCLKIRKKEIKDCKHEWNLSFFLVGKKQCCERCGLII